MAGSYQVKENETLNSIAKANGFISIDPIVDANVDTWPYLSTHPNALMAGMTLTIPDKKAKKLEQQTGTEVVYTVKAPSKPGFTLKIEDHLGEIVSVKDDVQLFINGSQAAIKDLTVYEVKPVRFKVFTAVDPLPDTISDAYLKIKFTSALNGNTQEKKIALAIGGVDPLLDPNHTGYSPKPSDEAALKKAVQKLLLNLGCYNGDLDGDLDKADSVIALMRFQTRYMQIDSDDKEFGRPGVRTCAALGAKQGVYLGPIQPISYG